ncbi:class I SAM-dependent methyltransferase [Rhodobacteraceae bacterium RKSG542]|uniref:class I SAM-dependent methyltransferase n=1 Tax=Pseudovibrio flavus TaxID=2529854 RepID=UPI0012BBF9F9|nr:class I SAM-dependent methyltransferase [Pseudovibrio flavus]MTI18875.1 class I SAM-dependent methyltransferase [Pseudovibrio flavus]
MIDPALETLFLPLVNEAIEIPAEGKTLFLRARLGSALRDIPSERLVCQQTFAPDASALTRAGYELVEDTQDEFPLVLVLPPRQRQEARALLAEAVARTKDGGIVIASVANTEGAKTCEADLAQLAGCSGKLSKNKCRVFWTQVNKAEVNADLLESWLALDAPREIEGGRYMSRPGVFSWDHIDPASQLLAESLPENLYGKGADLGAGLGYLADEVVTRCPKIVGVDLYEAEKRSLDLAKQNLAEQGKKKPLDFIWADITAGLKRNYDFVVMNPPFHTGKADRNDLGQAFIRAASQALRPGGVLWMVANRHLPYEATLDKFFESFEIIRDEKGYKVIQATKARK